MLNRWYHVSIALRARGVGAWASSSSVGCAGRFTSILPTNGSWRGVLFVALPALLVFHVVARAANNKQANLDPPSPENLSSGARQCRQKRKPMPQTERTHRHPSHAPHSARTHACAQCERKLKQNPSHGGHSTTHSTAVEPPIE